MDSGRIVQPIRLPFTIVTARGAHSQSTDQPSWGRRLGVWWDDAPEGDGVVVQGTMRTGAGALDDLRTGDRIVAINGTPAANLGALTTLLERAGSGHVLLTVRRPGMSDRSVTADLSPAAAGGGDAPSPPADAGTVPTTTHADSVREYIAFILSTPIQRDLMPAGAAADPDFGCAGAGFDFSQAGVPHSIIRAAIIAHEKRLEDVELESVDDQDLARPSGKCRRAIIVRGRLPASGQTVRFKYDVEELTISRARSSKRERAGFDLLWEDNHANGS